MNYTIPELLAISRKGADTILKPKVLWLTLIALVLLTTLIALVYQPAIKPASLWFPKARAEGVGTELRYLPVRSSVEASARELVEELLLGPMSQDFLPIAYPSSAVRMVLVRGRNLYVDLSADILFGRLLSSGVYSEALVAPKEVLTLFEKTLSWNFSAWKLFLTIEGKEPAFYGLQELTVEQKKQ
ncbi:MAG TPA: hypothetical protein DCG47_14310 [Spirochaetaceae bacterium]|nr:hypothetical protein [Spirochaetaceae bacterium]